MKPPFPRGAEVASIVVIIRFKIRIIEVNFNSLIHREVLVTLVRVNQGVFDDGTYQGARLGVCLPCVAG